MAKREEEKAWYEVVNVTGISNGIVYAELMARFDTPAQAAEHAQSMADQGWNTVAVPWPQTKDREMGEQIEILAERSEEIADLASKVQEQSEWDRNDKNNDLNWTVVRVDGTRNGMVYGEYIGNFDERQDALAFADGTHNWVAVPWGYGEKQEIGSEFEFVMGRSGEIDKIAKTMDRGKEVTEDLVVCKWDGRNGPPIIGNLASFDAGREWNGDARDRVASSIGVSGETVENEMYVMIRKGDGIERKGEIVQISDREETLTAWVEQCREAEDFTKSDVLEQTSFGIDRSAFTKLDEIAEEHQQQSQIDEELRRQSQL